jgi:hypothetical protein
LGLIEVTRERKKGGVVMRSVKIMAPKIRECTMLKKREVK